MDVKDIISDYEAFLGENASENTRASYVRDAKKFAAYMNKGNQHDLANIKRTDIEGYLSSLTDSFKMSTVSRSAASLKKFFRYLTEKGIIDENPARSIAVPTVKRKPPETLTVSQVAAFIDSFDAGTTMGARDRAMLELMYASGAKVTELIELKNGDINLAERTVTLRSSTDKSRTVPLGEEAVESVSYYKRTARKNIANSGDTDVFFLNVKGKRMTRQGFWKIVKKHASVAGINEPITTGTLRHSFALHSIERGEDAEDVSKMLGYSDVSSVKIYTKIAKGEE